MKMTSLTFYGLKLQTLVLYFYSQFLILLRFFLYFEFEVGIFYIMWLGSFAPALIKIKSVQVLRSVSKMLILSGVLSM